MDRVADRKPTGIALGTWLRVSANIDGSPLLDVMSGNLSHQIEHHLFPGLPSNRYARIAPRVRALCDRYRLPHTTGPLAR
jgi:NADPH-dependent stearoyl-CoA 9-desaturase